MYMHKHGTHGVHMYMHKHGTCGVHMYMHAHVHACRSYSHEVGGEEDGAVLLVFNEQVPSGSPGIRVHA